MRQRVIEKCCRGLGGFPINYLVEGNSIRSTERMTNAHSKQRQRIPCISSQGEGYLAELEFSMSGLEQSQAEEVRDVIPGSGVPTVNQIRTYW